jgi:hypothetical protein
MSEAHSRRTRQKRVARRSDISKIAEAFIRQAQAEAELAQASRDAANVLGVAFSETHSEPENVQ